MSKREAFTVRVQPEIAEALRQAAEEGSRPIGVVIHDAIVGYLGGWRAPSERIAEKQSKRRGRTGVAPTPFDGRPVDEFGWPLEGCMRPGTTAKATLMYESAQEIKAWMQRLWDQAGLGEYTDKHLQETLKALGPRKVAPTDGPKADWEQ